MEQRTTVAPRRKSSLVKAALLITAGIVGGTGCWRIDPRLKETHQLPPVEDAGIAYWRAAVYKKPLSAGARVRLGQALLKQDRLHEASREFQQVLAFHPHHLEALLGECQVAMRSNHPQRALQLAQQAAQLRPNHPRVLNNLALAFLQGNRLQEASQTFEKALALRPQDPNILLNAAKCAFRGGDVRRADEYCQRAVQADPQGLAPRLLRGNLSLRRGLLGQALEQFQQLAQDYPHNAPVWEALGRAYEAQDQPKEAIHSYLRAQKHLPDWPIPSLRGGYLCLHLRDYSSAVRFFRKALQQDAHSVQARLGLAEAYKGQGDPVGAIQVYEDLLQLDPQQLVALNNLADLYAQRGENLDRALQLAQQGMAIDPCNSAILDTLGWVYFRQGRYQEALLPLQKAVRLAPREGLIHYHLGQVLRASGENSKATKAFRKALSLTLPPDFYPKAQEALAACQST